jgi:AcrR family transcriptional regulator
LNKRVLQKEKTRQRILEAAYGEFAKSGVITARTDDVAKAAGVSHGSVFAHFESQDALISAVIWDFGQRIAQRTHDLACGHAGVREILAAHLTGLAEYEDFYFRLVSESTLLPAGCRDCFIMVQSAISLHLSEAVKRETELGLIRPMPLHLLFNTWIGLVHYYLINRELFAPGKSVIEQRGGELIEYFIGLIEK